MNIVKNLMDAHLYIIKKWVVDYLAEDKYEFLEFKVTNIYLNYWYCAE